VKFDCSDADRIRLQLARERLVVNDEQIVQIERWAEKRLGELRRRGDMLRQQSALLSGTRWRGLDASTV